MPGLLGLPPPAQGSTLNPRPAVARERYFLTTEPDGPGLCTPSTQTRNVSASRRSMPRKRRLEAFGASDKKQ